MDPLVVAKRLATLVEKEADRLGVPVTFSAIDVHGNMILKQRMTGAKLISIEMPNEKPTPPQPSTCARGNDPAGGPGEALHTLASARPGAAPILGGGVPLQSMASSSAGWA